MLTRKLKHLNIPDFLRVIFFLLTSLIVSFQPILGQENTSYTVKKYTSKNGLPQNSIKSMVMDPQRFLWITTEGGLVRFDGVHFKVYNNENTSLIQNNRFKWIVKTKDGKLFVDEIAGNVFEIKDGGITYIDKVNKASGSDIHIKGGVPDGEFFMNSLRYKFADTRTEELINYPVMIFPLPGEMHGIELINDVRIFKNNRFFKDIPIPGGAERSLFLLNNIIYCFSSENMLYYADVNSAVFKKAKLKGDLTIAHIKGNALPDNIIWSLAYQDVHLKSQNKLFRLDYTEDPSQIITKLITSDIPENCLVSDAFYDKKSNKLFVGTDTKGLYIFCSNFFKVVLNKSPNSNPTNSFYSQVAVDSHFVYAGSGFEYSHETFRKSSLPINNKNPSCLIKNKFNQVIYADNDKLLIYDLPEHVNSSINSSQANHEKEKAKRLKVISEGDGNHYFCFYEDGDSVLVGSLKGLGYIKNNKYTHLVNISQVGSEDNIEDIIRGPNGDIWIAGCNGVFIYHQKINKLSEVGELKGKCCRTLFREGDRIFVGTYGDGYYLIEDGKITTFPLDINHYLRYVHSFYLDRDSFMWMSTNNGIFKTRFRRIIKYTTDPTYRIYYSYYGEENGIINTEFNGGCSPSVLRLDNGYLSYPTIEGLVWVIPEMVPENRPEADIIVDEFLIDWEPVPSKDQLVIRSRHENVTVNFSTAYWGNIENLYMEYKLEGFNEDWVPIDGGENTISFSQLPHGNYELFIRKPQNIPDQPYFTISIPFYVEKTFYQTTLFRLLGVLTFVLIFLGIIRLNSARITRENLELEARINERTSELNTTNRILFENIEKLAEKEQFLRDSISVKDKLISVISHDIITPLKFISMVSRISKTKPEILEKSKLVESMQDIELATYKLYDNASNILNWMKLQNNLIKPQQTHIALHEFIDEIIESMEGMAATKGLRMENLIPDEDIIISDKFILRIVLENIISNAVKYSERGTIHITSSQIDTSYSMFIMDDGIGISAKKVLELEQILKKSGERMNPADDHEMGNRLGYYIISDFSQLLNAAIEIKSEPGKGTTVKITLAQ